MSAEQKTFRFNRKPEDVKLMGLLIAALQQGNGEFIVKQMVDGWEIILLG